MSVIPSKDHDDGRAEAAPGSDAEVAEGMKVSLGELTVTVERDSIVKVLEFLREDSQCRFETLVDLCGADYPTEPERFEVVYHLLSMRLNQRIRVKVRTDEVDAGAERDGRVPGRQLV